MADLSIPIQLTCFSLLVCQTAFTVLMIRYSRLRDSTSESTFIINPSTNERELIPLYATTSSVALSEFGKMWVGIIYTFYDLYKSSTNTQTYHTHDINNESNISLLNSLFKQFSNIIFGNFGTFILMAVPSVAYAIQNNLLMTALHHLDSSVYQVTYQCKTFSAAIFARFFLNKKYTKQHVMSFVLLAFGAAMASLSVEHTSSGHDTHGHAHGNDNTNNNSNINNDKNSIDENNIENGDERSLIVGLFCIALACVISGGAGTFMEATLKDASTTLATRNIQLGLFGCLTSLLVSFINGDFTNIVYPYGFLHGFNTYTWIVVISNIAGGYLVAIVIKYLSNIAKAFSGGSAVLLVCVGSYFIFNTGLSLLFVIGAISVVIGNIIYGLENIKNNNRQRGPILPTTTNTLRNSASRHSRSSTGSHSGSPGGVTGVRQHLIPFGSGNDSPSGQHEN